MSVEALNCAAAIFTKQGDAEIEMNLGDDLKPVT